MRTTWSAALAGNGNACREIANAAASAAPNTMCRDFLMTTSDLPRLDLPRSGSGLRWRPNALAHRDGPRNEAETEETIGHRLLGRDDIVGHLADGEGRTPCGDGLDV